MLKKFNQPDIAKALSNLAWLGTERLVQIGVAILISGMLARYFGPDTFGKWQYANTLLLVIAPLTWVCGAEILVPLIVREHAAATLAVQLNASGAASGAASDTEHANSLGAILGSAFTLRFTVSLAALLLCWGVLYLGWLDPLVAAMLAGLAVTMIFREPFGVVSAWLQSQTHSKPALLISLSTAILKAGAVFILVRLMVKPAHFGWLWAAEASLIAIILLLYFIWRNHGRLGWHIRPQLFKHLVSAGTVFWLGLICMYLFLKLDRLVLEHFVSYAELGRYSAAQQLNENWITLGLMLAQTLAPAFIYRIDNILVLRRNVIRLMALTAVVMVCGATFLDLIAGFVIRHVFGPAFLDATGIFRWAVWLSVPAGIEAIGNLIVLKYQAKYVLLGKWLLALCIALLVDTWLIPRLAGYGALIGLACGYLSAAAVNIYYYRFRLLP